LIRLRAGYHVIDFRAWKYPTAPEVWVHLYETFAKDAFDGSWRSTIPNMIRTSIASRGSGRLLRAYALFAIGLMPIFSLMGVGVHILNTLLLVFGLTGLIWLWTVIHGVQKTGMRLAKEYLTPTRHAEKLGLQATIGSDLQALLVGWMPMKPLGPTFVVSYWIITFVALVGTWLRLTELGSLEVWGHAIPWVDTVSWTRWGATGFDAVLLILAVIVFRWLQQRGPKRILLVVDDLDRCKPEHLLSVMESIKLLIEEPEISRRVQVAMLVEEEVLKHAIFQKYGPLTDPKSSEVLKTSYTADRLMRENCEKLFTASLRLPQLSKRDLRDVVRTFAGRGRLVQQEMDSFKDSMRILRDRMNDKPSLEMPDGTEPTYTPRMVRGETIWIEGQPKTKFRRATAEEIRSQEHEQAELADKARPILSRAEDLIKEMDKIIPIGASLRAQARDALRKASRQVLEDDEADAVVTVLEDDAIKLRDSLGPRSIRAFLFRYQFARLLIAKLGIDWEPTALARELAAQVLTDQSGKTDKIPLPVNAGDTDDQKLKRIVEQVC
jgi:hypothetical protein